MAIDLDSLTHALNATAETIKEASSIAEKDPSKASQYISIVKKHFHDLESVKNLKSITASGVNEAKKKSILSAIHFFLKQSKDAQERAGVLGATLFGTPEYKELEGSLEYVKNALEKKGKKVEDVKKGRGL